MLALLTMRQRRKLFAEFPYLVREGGAARPEGSCQQSGLGHCIHPILPTPVWLSQGFVITLTPVVKHSGHGICFLHSLLIFYCAWSIHLWGFGFFFFVRVGNFLRMRIDNYLVNGLHKTFLKQSFWNEIHNWIKSSSTIFC